MKTLMGLAGLTMAGFMLLSCNTEVKEANYQDVYKRQIDKYPAYAVLQ